MFRPISSILSVAGLLIAYTRAELTVAGAVVFASIVAIVAVVLSVRTQRRLDAHLLEHASALDTAEANIEEAREHLRDDGPT